MAVPIPIDLRGFRRGRARGLGNWLRLEGWIHRLVDSETDPDAVPLTMLKKMDHHPVVYLAEWAATGIPRKPDLYYVQHDDPAIRLETEAWLRPLLPRVLPALARAFVYGVGVQVFDWGEEDLTIRPPTKDGKKTRRKTLSGHQHYVRAHELWPGLVEVRPDEAHEAEAVRHEEIVYDRGRFLHSVWDRQYGELVGPAARRRAWRPWLKSLVTDTLHTRYLERSVDPPRKVYAPDGKAVEVQGDGTVEDLEQRINEFVQEKVDELFGGGTITFPSKRDEHGNLLFDVDVMDLPDREEVWIKALNRFDGQIMLSYLVSPGLGAEDVPAAGAKVIESLHAQFVQCLADWMAAELTALVREVHVRNHPTRTEPPTVKAHEIPPKVRKLYLELLKLVADPAMIGKEVDVRELLDQIGAPVRLDGDDEEGEGDGPKRPGGRSRDLAGDREERRDDARTDEGEEATGAEGEGEASE